MEENPLFAIVHRVANHLKAWRSDQRRHDPMLISPNGAKISVRQDKNRIVFYSVPPMAPDNRHRSWQSWGVPRENWRKTSITCAMDREPRDIARDLQKRLLSKVEYYWPIAMEKKLRELKDIETLNHVVNLLLKLLDGARISEWNSCSNRKIIYFESGSCEITTFSEEANLKFQNLSYTDTIKMAGMYQRMLKEKHKKMPRTKKQIEVKDLSKVQDYFKRKMATGDMAPMLVDGTTHIGLTQLETLVEQGNVHDWNQWIEQYLSAQGRTTLWGAMRGRSYRKDNPRNELNKSVADRLRECTGIEDINTAVMKLIEEKDGNI